VDRESGIKSIRYQIIDRRDPSKPLVEEVAPASTRYAEGTKRRKGVKLYHRISLPLTLYTGT